MEYKITIEKIETVKEERNEWQKLWDSEVFSQVESDSNLEQYAYRPVVKEITKETIVLEQTVETLDLGAVIKAINKL